MRTTFHLVPAADWEATDRGGPYAAPSLMTEGFIHCTDGEAELIDTANRYYREDPRPFKVLTIDLDLVGCPWRFDDPGMPYPHVYGPIPSAAIVAVVGIRRDDSGAFTGLDRRGDAPSSGPPA
jgi:uncharacterized protein (DUF952 family)